MFPWRLGLCVHFGLRLSFGEHFPKARPAIQWHQNKYDSCSLAVQWERQSTRKPTCNYNYDKFYEGDVPGAGIRNSRVGVFLRRDGMNPG